MSNKVKILVELPEEDYEKLKWTTLGGSAVEFQNILVNYILNGTVIKDDMISCEALKQEVERVKDTGYDTNNEPLFDFIELTTLFKLIDNAPTYGKGSEE